MLFVSFFMQFLSFLSLDAEMIFDFGCAGTGIFTVCRFVSGDEKMSRVYAINSCACMPVNCEY